MATTGPEFKDAWMAQWRSAARELAHVRAEALRSLSEADSVKMFNALDCPLPHPLRASSGFVVQQRYFKKHLEARNT